MGRIRLEPPPAFRFETSIPIRITDLNYGNHVGNDSLLSILHEARVQYLASFGYGELDFAGVGLIMSDVAIEFRAELFYGEHLVAKVQAAEFTNSSFEVYYSLEKVAGEQRTVVAIAKTRMVCYDYTLKKIAGLPNVARQALGQVN